MYGRIHTARGPGTDELNKLIENPFYTYKNRNILFYLSSTYVMKKLKIVNIRDRSFAKLVRNYIAMGVDLNLIDNKKRNALQYIAPKYGNHKHIYAKILIEMGINVNNIDISGHNALYYWLRSPDIVLLLLDNSDIYHDNMGFTLYKYYVTENTRNLEIIYKLLDKFDIKRVDKDDRTLLFYSMLYDLEDLVKKLLEKGIDVNHVDKYGYIALTVESDLDCVELVLRHPTFNKFDYVDPNGNNLILIYNNDTTTDYTIIEFLIEKGVNVNHINNRKQNALWYNYTINCIKILIHNGININQVDINGQTCLFTVFENRNIEKSIYIARYLIYKGIDINKRDNNGRTILFYISDIQRMKILINPHVHGRHGIDPKILDNNKNSALDYGLEHHVQISDEYEYVRYMSLYSPPNIKILDKLLKLFVKIIHDVSHTLFVDTYIDKTDKLLAKFIETENILQMERIKEYIRVNENQGIKDVKSHLITRNIPFNRQVKLLQKAEYDIRIKNIKENLLKTKASPIKMGERRKKFNKMVYMLFHAISKNPIDIIKEIYIKSDINIKKYLKAYKVYYMHQKEILLSRHVPNVKSYLYQGDRGLPRELMQSYTDKRLNRVLSKCETMTRNQVVKYLIQTIEFWQPNYYKTLVDLYLEEEDLPEEKDVRRMAIFIINKLTRYEMCHHISKLSNEN